MNRTIKFRGKRVDNGKWVVGYYAHAVMYPHSEQRHWILLAGESYEVIPESVGQSTGLKDSEDKEIFEGDIINSLDVMLKVFFNEATASFDIEWGGGDCEALVGADGWNPRDMKVVGKVIENPELLNDSPL